MDRATLLADLAMTRRHVAEGIVQLARQRAVIERMTERGRDTSDAISLLDRFEDIQGEHIAHRDRLEAMI